MVDNKKLDDYLLILKKRKKVKLEPEIKLFFKINGRYHFLGYKHYKEQYFIDNDKPFETKRDYFYSLIKLFKYKDYSELENPSKANTRLKLLRESIFIDTEINSISKEDIAYLELYFDSENNISLKILLDLLKKEVKPLNKSRDLIENKLKDLIKLENNIKTNILYVKNVEKIYDYYKDKKVNYKSINLIQQIIKIIQKKIQKIESASKFKIEYEELMNHLKDKQLELRLKINDLKTNITKLRNYKTKAKNSVKNISEIEKEQFRLNNIKFRVENDYCYCEKKLPKEKKEQIEKTGICPICNKVMESDIDNQKLKLQQEIIRFRRNCKIYSNKIKRIESKNVDFGKEIQEISKEVKNLKETINNFKVNEKINGNLIKKCFLERLNLLNSYQREYVILQNYKANLKDLKDRLNQVLEDKSKNDQIFLNLSKKFNLLNNFINIIQNRIRQEHSTREYLKTKFDDLQKNIIKNFITEKKIEFIGEGNQDFTEITLKAKFLEISQEVIHLNYFLSILKLIFLQDSNNMGMFHSFPILVIKGISDDTILKKTIQVLERFKPNEFQVLIFCPFVDKNKISEDLSENINMIRIKKTIEEKISDITRFL